MLDVITASYQAITFQVILHLIVVRHVHYLVGPIPVRLTGICNYLVNYLKISVGSYCQGTGWTVVRISM